MWSPIDPFYIKLNVNSVPRPQSCGNGLQHIFGDITHKISPTYPFLYIQMQQSEYEISLDYNCIRALIYLQPSIADGWDIAIQITCSVDIVHIRIELDRKLQSFIVFQVSLQLEFHSGDSNFLNDFLVFCNLV